MKEECIGKKSGAQSAVSPQAKLLKTRQVKVHVPLEVFIALKNMSAAHSISMSALITKLIVDATGINRPKMVMEPDYSTRRRRNAAITSIIKEIQRIKEYEERYRDNIPENLQNSVVYEAAEQHIEWLDEVLEVLIPF